MTQPQYLGLSQNRSWAWMKSAKTLPAKGLKEAQGVPAAVRRAFLKVFGVQEISAIHHEQLRLFRIMGLAIAEGFEIAGKIKKGAPAKPKRLLNRILL